MENEEIVKSEDIFIWSEANTGRPICDMNLAVNLAAGRQQVETLISVKIPEETLYIKEIFSPQIDFTPIYKKYIIIKDSKKIEINKFITEHFAGHFNLIYTLIININHEISKWELYLNEFEDIIGDFRTYQKDDEVLNKVIELYKEGKLFQSVSFKIKGGKIPYKIQNPIIINSMMWYVKESYIGGFLNFDFATRLTATKQTIAKCLFDFLKQPGTPWYLSENKEAHLLIKSLFTLADFHTGESAIKQWIKRARQLKSAKTQ